MRKITLFAVGHIVARCEIEHHFLEDQLYNNNGVLGFKGLRALELLNIEGVTDRFKQACLVNVFQGVVTDAHEYLESQSSRYLMGNGALEAAAHRNCGDDNVTTASVRKTDFAIAAFFTDDLEKDASREFAINYSISKQRGGNHFTIPKRKNGIVWPEGYGSEIMRILSIDARDFDYEARVRNQLEISIRAELEESLNSKIQQVENSVRAELEAEVRAEVVADVTAKAQRQARAMYRNKVEGIPCVRVTFCVGTSEQKNTAIETLVESRSLVEQTRKSDLYFTGLAAQARLDIEPDIPEVFKTQAHTLLGKYSSQGAVSSVISNISASSLFISIKISSGAGRVEPILLGHTALAKEEIEQRLHASIQECRKAVASICTTLDSCCIMPGELPTEVERRLMHHSDCKLPYIEIDDYSSVHWYENIIAIVRNVTSQYLWGSVDDTLDIMSYLKSIGLLQHSRLHYVNISEDMDLSIAEAQRICCTHLARAFMANIVGGASEEWEIYILNALPEFYPRDRNEIEMGEIEVRAHKAKPRGTLLNC